ncbi:MAG: MlaA family lipoprotein [Deltaproteobacteria bacterium]|nr:MlaA family lipoprotein [Deltaproteobacteria bacterium]
MLQQPAPPPPNFPDPLEPANRAIWDFNHGFIEWVAAPLGRAYRFVVPRVARERLRDFANNLDFPRNLVGNLLQGNRLGAGHEIARFAVNSTVGVAGLWDPATHWLHIDAMPEDFGQVFARWGWRPSTYAVLPIVGPSSVRDGVGMLPDMVLDPARLVFPASLAFKFNDQVDSIEEYRRFAASSFDIYDDARLLSSAAREVRIEPPAWSPVGEDSAAVQTLQAAFFGPQDHAFAGALRTGRVRMAATGRELPYSYRLQPGGAPLVFVVPGLGAHRLSSGSVALAELAWRRGCSVAIVSSPLNAEFIADAGSVPVPGHAPIDAHDVHLALDAIARDLAARDPGRITARIYLGYSLGAFHGFYIAAAERQSGEQLITFDRYVLLDTPVSLFDGMQRLDAYREVLRHYPQETQEAEGQRILLKAVAVGKRALADRTGAEVYATFDASEAEVEATTPPATLPFTNTEAEFLIGNVFQRSLKAVLYESQQREDLGVLRTERRRLRRQPPYEEIADYSFTGYFYAFVLPYHRDRLGTVGSAEQMVQQNDLRSLTQPLRGNRKLRVFVNQNDFLTSDADLAWLSQTVGEEQVRVFPSGGHLGNLHRPEVQIEVMQALDGVGAIGDE